MAPVTERPIWLAGDNKASLSWATKGSSTSTAARAYLLRLNALHQRRHRYVPLHDYIAGKANATADNASRRWDLSDAALLTYPQTTSWRLLHLTPEMYSAVIGALSRKRSTRISLCSGTPPPLAPGKFGNVSASPPASARTCSTCQATPSRSSCSLPNDTGQAPSHLVTNPCALAQRRTRSVTLRRRSPGWGPLTLA